MAKRPRILWVGDGGLATGFARVNHSIINNLPEGKYDIHHLAINYRGDPYPDAKAPMYPAILGGDIYGINRMTKMLEALEPDLVFILNDPWILSVYLERLPDGQKTITYFPVDAKPIHRDWCEAITQRSVPVAYTKFGKGAITEQMDNAKVHIIPHGIDLEKFYPMDAKKARGHLKGVGEDDFVILNANRNQPRKRVDLTIKGFAKFAEDKPENVRLYLHMNVEDMGWHVITLCERLGVAHRLLLTSLELSPANPVSDERLNWIYNACDVGLNTSMGEGWGLTTFEHGACKRAQIVPNSSAPAELYDNCTYKLPIVRYETYPRVLTEGAVVSEEDVVKALEYYYQNPDKREQDAQAIYDFITQPKFDWKKIALQWDALFEEVLGS